MRLPAVGALTSLETCGPKSSGVLYRDMWMDDKLVVVVVGTLAEDLRAYHDIRVDEGSACLVGVKALTWTMQRSKSRFGFVKADFPAKSGHSVEAGRGAQVRRLECALE